MRNKYFQLKVLKIVSNDRLYMVLIFFKVIGFMDCVH
jgi:hypothetical protein